MEACCRYKALADERRANREMRKQEAAEQAAKFKIKHCSFCSKSASAKRILVGDGVSFICERCLKTCAKIVVKRKARGS
jgi:hypothetical protein